MSVYGEVKVYGPYKRKKDGRQTVILVDKDGKRQTVSYPKYLVEQKLGRKLKPDETVDHKDRDIDNNEPSNLKVITRKKHIKEDAWRLKPMRFVCPMPNCRKSFIREGQDLRNIFNDRRKGKAGPFCSRECAGRYGAAVRDGLMEPIEETYEEFLKKHPRQYYQKKKPKEKKKGRRRGPRRRKK